MSVPLHIIEKIAVEEGSDGRWCVVGYGTEGTEVLGSKETREQAIGQMRRLKKIFIDGKRD